MLTIDPHCHPGYVQINASSLRNIGSGSHDERDHNVLEYKNPRMTIPLQTATTILLK